MIALDRDALRGSRSSMELVVEQKRRNVFRVTGLYVIGAWLLTQIATTVLRLFEMPGRALRALLVVPAFCFDSAGKNTDRPMPATASRRVTTPAGSA
jgi:hypothetical protein